MNKTRLKVSVLEKFPEAQKQHEGKSVVIDFKEGMKNMLTEALKKYDFSEDVAILAKATNIVEMIITFNHDQFTLTGSFPPKYQDELLSIAYKLGPSTLQKGQVSNTNRQILQLLP